MTQAEQKKAAKTFVKEWTGKGYEKGESQKFWIDLLSNVFGIRNFADFVTFEDKVVLDHTSFIDARIPSTKVLIEQKSIEKDLRAPVKQSDGSMLTPFQQAKRYSAEMPYSERPRWIVTCNFAEFLIYDMENPRGEPEQVLLKDLEQDFYRLQFLVDSKSDRIRREEEISLKAGELVGKLYDALYKEYINPTAESLRSLNILCVRIVFCLYAEDAGLFKTKTAFEDYVKSFRVENLRDGIIKLFKALDTKEEHRNKYDKKLDPFPYVNGGLFADEDIEIPNFSEEIVDVIVNYCAPFDWSEISPTIFGAVFESTLNPETRRSGGMHYTSIENIHKVIDPLFMDGLWNEFHKIVGTAKFQRQKLLALQDKIAELKFLDPACGSGNFLTETFICLRRLENEILKLLMGDQIVMGKIANPVKVSIAQFYGIEINDFAVNVAKAALWIAESQMLQETEDIVQHDIDFLPLRTNATIVEGNALRMDWTRLSSEETVPEALVADKLNIIQVDDVDSLTVNDIHLPYNQKENEITVITREVEFKKPNDVDYKAIASRAMPPRNHYDYIMGNPPFVGARMMEQGGEQKQEILELFGDIKDVQDLDYVTGWYYKAAELVKDSQIEAAFVSTNSICQGAQVPILWKELFEKFGIRINFAYQTFKWMSESTDMAAVHCVVVGFANFNRSVKKIYTNEGVAFTAQNISPYLFDGTDVFVEAQKKPLCDVPKMNFGNQPRDGGNLIVSEEDYSEIVKQEPSIAKWIRPYIGADEFINNGKRYCFWLKNAEPETIKKSKILYGRVDAVRRFRLDSKAKTTNGYAKVPHLFAQITQPDDVDYLLIPSTTSSNRVYIPIGFKDSRTISSNAVQIIPGATLFHFGVLTSKLHMAWMRTVAGRLKSDYRYSKEIVYNSFPWPELDERRFFKTKIEAAAQKILDVRAKYPNSSLAALYDEATMPLDLRKAHSENDKAVMEAYGFSSKMPEEEIVAELFKMYGKLTRR